MMIHSGYWSLLLVAVCLSFAASEDFTPLEVSVEQAGDRNADSITEMMPKVPRPESPRCSWLATKLPPENGLSLSLNP